MRVALVHDFHATGTPSGENEVVEAEAAALEKAGVDVRVAGVRNDDLARRPFHGLQAAATVASGRGVSPLRLLGGFRPDVVHVHSLFPYLGRDWIGQVGVPLVTTVHSYRSLCANGYLFRDGEVCTLCADGRPWSGVRYGCYRGSRLATVPLAWAGRRGPSRDPVLSAADRVLVLSERSRTLLAQRGVPEQKLRVDWHFVPDEHIPASEPPTARTGFLFVGRLTPEKGVDRLVEAWPDDVPLRIVGDGPLRPSLEAGAGRRPIDFAGPMDRARVLAEMQRAFGLVFPSRWYETFGLVYIEALAAGLPTLAFPPNVVADAVERDGTGAVASWDRLGESVARAEGSFEGLRRRCRSLFAERYDQQAFVARRVALYEELLK